jgi:hypothetical protein
LVWVFSRWSHLGPRSWSPCLLVSLSLPFSPSISICFSLFLLSLPYCKGYSKKENGGVWETLCNGKRRVLCWELWIEHIEFFLLLFSLYRRLMP